MRDITIIIHERANPHNNEYFFKLFDILQINELLFKEIIIILPWASLTQPAPNEPPQGRKTARIIWS